MIIKRADEKQPNIELLENLQNRPDATDGQKQAIDKEIRILLAGIKGETESAYLIDFDFKTSKNTAVIHDLRIEINGRVAQIDHLLIHRTLTVFVLETKHFHSGMKITDEGEFMRWNDFKKCYEGMPSPLAQNERHIEVLKDAFSAIDMPTRLGIRLSPSFESYVLASTNARIDRSKKFDSSRIIKADVLLKTIEKQWDNEGILDTLGSMGKFVSTETIEDISKKLCSLHRPIVIDYAAKFGFCESPSTPAVIASLPTPPPTAKAEVAAPAIEQTTNLTCRHCGSDRISVQYGKFGYYFKCGDCDGNTPIKIGCGIDGHKERIRKEGRKFFRECADCKTSSLYFENQE